MENTDRAGERSQAGVVQGRRFGLSLSPDKPGASLHPPRAEPSSAPPARGGPCRGLLLRAGAAGLRRAAVAMPRSHVCHG